jgi:hypothetical protein
VGIEPTTYALRGRRLAALTALPAPTTHPTAPSALPDLGERPSSCQKSCQTRPRRRLLMLVPDRKIDRLTMLTTAGCMPHLPTAQCSDPVVPSMAGAPRRRQSQRSRTRKGPRCLARLLEGSRPAGDAADHFSSTYRTRVCWVTPTRPSVAAVSTPRTRVAGRGWARSR